MKCDRFSLLLLCLAALLFTAGCGDKKTNTSSAGTARWSHFPVSVRHDGFAEMADPAQAATDFDAAVQFWNGHYALHFPGASALASNGPFLNAFSAASLTDTSVLLETGVASTAAWPLPSTLLGTTAISTTNNKIANALVGLNLRDHTFCHGTCGAPGDISYRRVMAHEFGHLLGIAEHSADPMNVMYDGNYHEGDLNLLYVEGEKLRAITP